jgi:hypothetical protein
MTLRVPVLGVIFLALAPASLSSNQSSPAVTTDPVGLVRRATQNRLDADKTHRPLRYLLRKIDGPRDTTKDIIETSDGDVARLVAINGLPLSTEANQAELDRLNILATHPAIQEHRHQREQKDVARVNRLMRLLPDAFLYRFEGMVDCAGGPCYRLTFTPNPHFAPPDLEASIFRGLAGEVWIDQAQERLTRLDAHFIETVDFGWGMLGKLEKGGTILLEQADVGGHDWELTALKLNLRGKALMVKSLSIQIAEQADHFSPVPPGADYRKAIHLLLEGSPENFSIDSRR